MISKTRSIFRGITVTVGILLLLICLIIPWALNIWLLPSVGEQLGVKYSANNIWLNPITGTVTIEKGVIKQQQSPFLKWHELHANLDMLQLFKGRIVIEQVALQEPEVWLQQDKQNKWNFESLKLPENKTPETTEQKPVEFAVQEAVITTGAIYYSAYRNSNPVHYQLKDINFLMEELTSDFSAPFKTKLDFVTANKGLFSWQGETILAPLSVKGKTQIQHLNLPTIVELLPQSLPIKLKQGELSKFETAIHVQDSQQKLAVTLEKIGVELSQLDLKLAKKGQGSLTFDRFTLNDGHLKWPDNQLHLGDWQLDKLTWQGKLNQQRQLSWVTAFQTKDQEKNTSKNKKPETNSSNSKQTEAKPWQIGWQQGMVKSSRFNLKDLSIQPEAAHQLDLAKLSLKPWHNNQKQPLQVAASGQLAAGGKFTLDSKVGLTPLQVEGSVELEQFTLAHYQQYWQPFIAAELKGTITTKIKAEWQPNNQSDPYQIAGDFQWDNWLLKQTNTSKVIGQGKQLRLTGISLLPNKFNVSAVTLDTPDLFLQREPEQRWNFSPLFPAQPKTTQTVNKQPATKPWEWFIGLLEIRSGELDFRDATVSPVAEFNLNQISGNIKQLSSEEKKSNLQLRALIADSDLTIEGELIPLNPRKLASVKFAVNNMSLPMFSSYASKYLGYPVKRGKLGATLYYNVKDFNLQSDNKVTLNKLKLGKKTASKDAVDAPVKLALALLEDGKGKIALDVPVKGDFSKPDVKYGKLLRDAVFKLFKSIAASPFNLLGGLVDFSGEDVNLIKFQPGSLDLPKTEQEKLIAITKLLEKRPNLILEVEGQFDVEQDKPALVQSVMLDKLEISLGKLESVSAKQKKQWLRTQLEQAGIITNDSMSTDFLTRLYAGTIQVSDRDLTNLAKQRAKTISAYITRQGNIKKDRIYRLEVKEVNEKVKGDITSILTINAP
ncbi:DUF748 domain-containing protein [Spartinivicinus poritis]|uniref:DUF748 domain-containing protein n=1 Tax=Spartinivicinus poritis TaxID=2994640 RepID=A0ABT5U978_9GAMM|nr:DUF748 domain-containing protein [Spartinivicinus sp. A2-2]MDE1462923.1 DUF748 domain-containing protein [Spartinivicinus sp. A2-2]